MNSYLFATFTSAPSFFDLLILKFFLKGQPTWLFQGWNWLLEIKETNKQYLEPELICRKN